MNLTKRQTARDEVFKMLFEHAFNLEKSAEDILHDAKESRSIPEDSYIFQTLAGVISHEEALLSDIERYAVGWKRNRISAASIAVMTLCLYEMRFCPDIPLKVSVNEAVELVKRYDDEGARAFVNGILNSALKEFQNIEGLKNPEQKKDNTPSVDVDKDNA